MVKKSEWETAWERGYPPPSVSLLPPSSSPLSIHPHPSHPPSYSIALPCTSPILHPSSPLSPLPSLFPILTCFLRSRGTVGAVGVSDALIGWEQVEVDLARVHLSTTPAGALDEAPTNWHQATLSK